MKFRFLAGLYRGLPLQYRQNPFTVAMQKGLDHMEITELKVYAEGLLGHPQHADLGRAILKLEKDWSWLDESFDAMRSAFGIQDIEMAEDGDPVATLEWVLKRYGYVREVFNNREEFDLNDSDYSVKLPGVLAMGDRALSFKWKVAGVLRKAGAIPDGAVKMDDDALLMILEMMMP